MHIIHTKTFDSSYKKLKKHRKEYSNLLIILDLIENARDFNELCKLPQSKIYKLERLKHEMSNYYSYNLCKNKGKIRLIVKPNDDNSIELYLITISYDHYEDFNPKEVNYYE